MSHADSTTQRLVTPAFVLVRVAGAAAAIFGAGLWAAARNGGLAKLRLDLRPHLHAPRWELLAGAAPVIRFHVAAALTAFLIGSVLLAGAKGSGLHRTLGWAWCAAMFAAAVSSLFIRVVDPGHWSFIHVLSGWVIVAVPMGLVAIRRKKVAAHRRTMTGLFVGGLVIAGAFTFAPGRLMWSVFLG